MMKMYYGLDNMQPACMELTYVGICWKATYSYGSYVADIKLTELYKCLLKPIQWKRGLLKYGHMHRRTWLVCNHGDIYIVLSVYSLPASVLSH